MAKENSSEKELKSPDRRKFLKGVAGVTGGVIASCFIEDAPIPERSNELKHLTLKDGIDVGIGHSDFQAAPKPLGKEPVTDWEKALIDTQNGVQKIIRGDLDNLPDFHNDYKKQIDRVADELNNTMFRMSLDFGRLCPKEGEFNHELMAEYIRIIAYCRKKGLQPLVTLHHWPMPLAFCEMENGKMKKGAWEHPEILAHFRFYIEKIIEYFLDPDKIKEVLDTDPAQNFSATESDEIVAEGIICKTFITINEPMMHVISPYWIADFPPYKFGEFAEGQKVLKKVSQAHEIAYHEIHEAAAASPNIQTISNQVQLGVAYNFIKFVGDSWLTRLGAEDLDEKLNWQTVETMEKNANSSDFMGVQYYSAFGIGWRDALRFTTGYKPDIREYGDHPGFGYLDPKGMQEFLLELGKRYPDKSKMVTEFGFADKKDKKRPYLIMETVDRILAAKEQGVKIDAILLWSLINNLEWTAGTAIHLGLYDHKGDHLPSDNGEQISSREVWATLSKYLHNANEETKNKVLELHKKAKEQYEAEIALAA